MPGENPGRGQQNSGAYAAGAQPLPDVAGPPGDAFQDAAAGAVAGPTPPHATEHDRDTGREDHQRAGGDEARDGDPPRQRDEQDRQRGGGENDLTRAPLEHHGLAGRGHVPSVAAVPHGPVDVAEDAAGEHAVEEQCPVVVADRAGQGQPDAEARRHEAPPPRAEDGRDRADRHRGRQGRRVDGARRDQERPVADARRQQDQHGGTRREPAGPDEEAPPLPPRRRDAPLACRHAVPLRAIRPVPPHT